MMNMEKGPKAAAETLPEGYQEAVSANAKLSPEAQSRVIDRLAAISKEMLDSKVSEWTKVTGEMLSKMDGKLPGAPSLSDSEKKANFVRAVAEIQKEIDMENYAAEKRGYRETDARDGFPQI